MIPGGLQFGFGGVHRILELNLAGISEEESRLPPGAEGNCINWLAGHIVASRMRMAPLLGLRLPISEEEAGPYRQGGEPLLPGRNALTLARLTQALQESGEEFRAKVGSLTAAQLEASIPSTYFPMPVQEPTMGKLLTLFLFHESYHAGQIGIVRRILGKPSGMGA